MPNLVSLLIRAALKTTVATVIVNSFLAPTLAAAATCAQPQLRWITSWAAPPQATSMSLAAAGDPIIPTFDDQTIRMIVTPNAAGSEVRIRLSNRFGSAPVTFSATRVARSSHGAQLVAGTSRQLTFGGRPSVTIPARGHTISDAALFDVRAGERLAVSFHVLGLAALDAHVWGMQTSFVADAGSGDRTADLAGAQFVIRTTARYALSGVDVRTTSTGGVVAVIGDSITDGIGSTVDGDHRWTDALAGQLASAHTRLTVVNAGISGGQVAGSSERVGRSIPDRIGMDALSLSGTTHVVIAGGINDLWYGANIDPFAAVTSAYRRAAEAARAAGIAVVGATIPPAGQSGGVEWYRVMINNWIKTTSVYDAVVDLDAALRDPAHTNFMQHGLTNEVVHPNDAGYSAMAAMAGPSITPQPCR